MAQLKIKGEPVDTINIDVSAWAPDQKVLILEMAKSAFHTALFDKEVEVKEDPDTPPLLF